MSNKIGGTGPKSIGRIAKLQRYPAPSAGLVATPQGVSADSVTLTESASLLRAAEAVIEQTPDMDAARINGIKQAIARGDYQVDPQRIATQMLKLEGFLPAPVTTPR